MPVYVRKRQESLDLSKFDDDSPEIDADFILDPEKFRDELPQPYRCIDKVIESLLEVSFQEIFKREEERQTEETRYKPPVAPTDLFRQIKDVSEVKFLTHSQDEKFVFCSSANKLLALGAVSMETLAKYEAADLEIAFVSVARISTSFYLLATLDDIGIARLFAFDSSSFHLVKVLNEEEGEKKLICLELQLADSGEFVALTLQNSSTRQVNLEFLRLPLETWAKEVEQQTDKSHSQKPAAAITEERDEADAAGDDGSVGNSEDTGRQPQLKMSPPTAVLRVRPPPEVVSTSATPNFKAVDISGEVIGSGSAHLLTQTHLQLREANFRAMRCSEMQQLPPDSWMPSAVVHTASVVFLRPGRSVGNDAASESRVCAACVAWAGDHRILNFSLLRSGKAAAISDSQQYTVADSKAKAKVFHRQRSEAPAAKGAPPDLEFKPDIVWPFGSAVTSVAASPCKSLLGVGLENGNLCLQDIRLGMLRHVIRVSDSQPIRKLLFLNPAAFPDSSGEQIYQTRVSTKLVALTSDWSAHIIDSKPDTEPEARPLPTSARHESEAAQLVQLERSHPTLLLRAIRNGAIVLHDVTVPQDVLQFSLPQPWQLAEPWQASSWTLAANGRSLVVRGVSGETGEDALFCCNLRILIPMSQYWSRQLPEAECFVHNSLTDRVDAYLLHRANSHTQRQQQLSEIWCCLSETLSEVQAAARAEDEPPQSVRSIHTSMSNHSDEIRLPQLQY